MMESAQVEVEVIEADFVHWWK